MINTIEFKDIGKFTGFIPGMGNCLDIRFEYRDREEKTFIPLSKIRRIMPHTADRAWTRIYYGDDDSFFTVPITYDKLVNAIIEWGEAELCFEEETEEETNE